MGPLLWLRQRDQLWPASWFSELSRREKDDPKRSSYLGSGRCWGKAPSSAQTNRQTDRQTDTAATTAITQGKFSKLLLCTASAKNSSFLVGVTNLAPISANKIRLKSCSLFESYFPTKLLFVYFCKSLNSKREKDPEIHRTENDRRHAPQC